MKTYRHISTAQFGFTLAETLLGVVFLAIGAGAAAPSVATHLEERRVELAVKDIVSIEHALERYRTIHHALPDSLDQLGVPVPVDPWGRAYEYFNFTSRGLSEQRVYHSLPLNSDYDLYSRGRDGYTDLMINAAPARNNIVRGRDGEFIGLAADF